MNTARDVISMLEDSGAQKLYASNGHIKYKLPNGRLFISAGTPSDVRSYKNAIAFLRRELKLTHPEIAQRHKALPKNKRFGHHTMGDALALKGFDLNPQPIGLAAIPGAELIEADFELVEPPPVVEPEIRKYKPNLKARRDPAPPPGKPKTLTPDQLKEANRILVEKGQAAMDNYISGVRDAMCDVCKELKQQRFPEPISPQNRVPANHIFSEEDEMSSVLERARQELESTYSRIRQSEETILNTQISLDADIAKRTSLESYIEEHEALANRAATLIADILPPVVAPIAAPQPIRNHTPAPKQTRNHLDYGMAMIEKRVYPILKERGFQEFDMGDVLDAIKLANLQPPTRVQIQNWFFANLKHKKTMLVKGGPGKFAFKESTNG